MTIKKATLVLEGGATRGIFTSGALDYLMERDLYFSDVIGVSAAPKDGTIIRVSMFIETGA